MPITKQCSDRIVTIMPNGQFTLDRVLAEKWPGKFEQGTKWKDLLI